MKKIRVLFVILIASMQYAYCSITERHADSFSISMNESLEFHLDSLLDGSCFMLDDSLLNMDYPEASIKKVYPIPPSGNNYSHSLHIQFTPTSSDDPYYLIVTTHNLYDLLSNEIRRYAEDVHAIYGYGVFVESTENASPQQLKTLITNYNNNLCGVFFIGDLDGAMYEVENDHEIYGYKTWPCDLFFMDLDGVWTDTDGNGIYDQHSGLVAPNIFFGRLPESGLSSMGNSAELIRQQLHKSHDFWWKESYHSCDTVLNYIDNDWKNSFPASQLAPIFQSTEVHDIRYGNSPLFSSSDYIHRITYGGYGFTHLAAHSSPSYHSINNSLVTAYTIKDISSNNYAYNLFCCSACNWMANNNCYLGGAYLYNGKTLAVVGSTKIGAMLGDSYFYNSFPTQNIGESLLQWWISYIGNSHNMNEKYWFYGMTLLGDPTINFRHRVADYCENDLQLTGFPQGDSSNFVLMKAQNSINSSQSFVIPQNVQVVYDAPKINIERNFCCPIGSLFETRSEGCEL